ncbi:MAG TPA: GNAT family N-acetyltransferase [Casimicrobiaceae bacterium]|nr:GNAT family N-acetyltransferase [Casimicrobiaceae bacterium]
MATTETDDRHAMPRHAKSAARFREDAGLRDGTPVCVRAIRPDDRERLRIAFDHLSARTVYQRFFHPVTALTSNELRHATEIDFRNHVSLALTIGRESGERLIGLARFVRVARGAHCAEIAVTVVDEYQGRGAGTLLLQHIVCLARAGGVRELIANVLENNAAMMGAIRNLELPSRYAIEDGVRRVMIDLDAGPARSEPNDRRTPSFARSMA